jgi:hypothetical protein
MHGVGLTLMAEKARCGGKPRVLTRVDLAPIRLEVGIHKLAAPGGVWLVRERRGKWWV